MYFTTVQRAMQHLTRLTFICSPLNNNSFTKCLDFIQLLCTHDSSKVTYAAELSTNLIVFLSDYDYIFFH